MKKFLFGFLATALVFSFNSCKKCYNCTKPENYCYDCMATLQPECGECQAFGQTLFSACDDGSSTPSYSQQKSACQTAQGTWAITQQKEDTTLVACGATEGEANSQKLIYELMGATCTKRTSTTVSQEVCGSNSTNAGGTKTAMEAAGYTCTAK